MTDRQRKIEALRRLAAAPGTPAEGEVARRMLERLEAVGPEEGDDPYWDAVHREVRSGATRAANAMHREHSGFTEAELEKEFAWMFKGTSFSYGGTLKELNRKIAEMLGQDPDKSADVRKPPNFMGTLNRAAGGATRKSGKGG